MSLRTFAVATALVSSLALAACGSEEKSGNASSQSGQTSTSGDGATATAETTSASQARAEIGEVRTGLAAAVASLEDGDAKAAENAVSEAYLQHFELVEGPLEKVDEELKEKLEHAIREDLRDKIRNGASVTEVTAMVSGIKADLDTAEQKLG